MTSSLWSSEQCKIYSPKPFADKVTWSSYQSASFVKGYPQCKFELTLIQRRQFRLPTCSDLPWDNHLTDEKEEHFSLLSR